jgi:hypothetical protein
MKNTGCHWHKTIHGSTQTNSVRPQKHDACGFLAHVWVRLASGFFAIAGLFVAVA